MTEAYKLLIMCMTHDTRGNTGLNSFKVIEFIFIVIY